MSSPACSGPWQNAADFAPSLNDCSFSQIALTVLWACNLASFSVSFLRLLQCLVKFPRPDAVHQRKAPPIWRAAAFQVLALTTLTALLGLISAAIKLSGIGTVFVPSSVVFDVFFFLVVLFGNVNIFLMHWSLIGSAVPPALATEREKRLVAGLRVLYSSMAGLTVANSITFMVVTAAYSDADLSTQQDVSDIAFVCISALHAGTTASAICVWVLFLSRHVLGVLQRGIDSAGSHAASVSSLVQLRKRILSMRKRAYTNAFLQFSLCVSFLCLPVDTRHHALPYYAVLNHFFLSIVTQVYAWNYRPPPPAAVAAQATSTDASPIAVHLHSSAVAPV